MTTNLNLSSTPVNSKRPAVTIGLILCLAALCSGVAGAQTLSSGGNYDGTILLGQTNTWAFTANVGDRIVLRGAALTSTNAFEPWLRIYNPGGVLIADSGINSSVDVEELALTATNSGTYTVLITDTDYGGFIGTGAYRLYFAQLPGTFVVPPGDEGGSLASGGNYDGTIQLGDLDFWSFTANTGDRVVLRGAALTSTNAFDPWLRIYDPHGVLVADSGVNSSVDVEELTLTATNSGTFTVLMTDTDYGEFIGTGTYRLYFAQLPGTFVVPPGDDGGSLTNGGNYSGTIQLGDLDLWSFSANAGDRIIVRGAALTSTNDFEPWLRIYDPHGVLVADSGINSSVDVEELDLTATNSGTFTVLMTDTDYGGFIGTGTYRLYVAHLPGALVVASGEEGGSLIAGVDSLGTIQLGDLDQWRFTACKDNAINLQVNQLSTTNNFNPWLRLYGPNGVLIGDSGVNSSATVAQVTVATTNEGTFTVIVTDSAFGGFDGTGTYRLSSNGLSYGLKLCFPTFPGTNVALAEVGGVPGATFVLFTQTNIAAAAALWTPIYTNQFDSFGVGSETNAFSRSERQSYFHLDPQSTKHTRPTSSSWAVWLLSGLAAGDIPPAPGTLLFPELPPPLGGGRVFPIFVAPGDDRGDLVVIVPSVRDMPEAGQPRGQHLLVVGEISAAPPRLIHIVMLREPIARFAQVFVREPQIGRAHV